VYSSPNSLALFLERVLPLLLAVALLPGEAGRVRRGLYGLGAGVAGAALLLTFSRGALLLGLPAALVVMALLFGLRFPPARRRALLAGAGGAALLAAIGVSARALGADATGFFRVKLWQSSLAMLREAWPLGIGPGNFLYLYRTRFILPEAWQEPNLSHPHNILLDFTVRLGLGGLLIFGWLQLAFWRTAWRLYRRHPWPLLLGLMGSMAAGLAHGLIDNGYFLVDLAFIFFLTVGLVQGLSD
jgi:O-antigen ligase